MTRIGILNLTRFGDLVQTTPVLTGLRKRHPDAHIELIAKSRFRAVADMLPGLDAIHEIDGDALARALADPESSFVDAWHAASDVVDGLTGTRYDVVYNFTNSRASAVLLSLLDADQRVGYSIDRQGLRHVQDPWLAHLGTVVRARRLSRFNLVDVYLGAAGLAGCGERMSVRIPQRARGFAEAELPRGPRYVAVQLGASQDTKMWSLERFAATLRALAALEPELVAVPVGVPAELEAAERLVSLCPEVRFHSLVARTRVDELAACLERCALLLTGDTGTMHLAGAVGTTTVAVFVGLGTPWETGTYGEGHLALLSRIGCAPCQHHVRCGYPACHEDVPPEWLAGVLSRSLRGESIDDVPALPRADLFLTRYDAAGLFDLAPVHARPPGPEDLASLVWRAVFTERLMGVPLDPDALERTARERYGIDPADWARILPSSLDDALQQLESVAAKASLHAHDLARAPGDAASAQAIGAALALCDERIYEISRGEPLLVPAGLALEGALTGLPEADLGALARQSAGHYEDVVRAARVLRERLTEGSIR